MSTRKPPTERKKPVKAQRKAVTKKKEKSIVLEPPVQDTPPVVEMTEIMEEGNEDDGIEIPENIEMFVPKIQEEEKFDYLLNSETNENFEIGELKLYICKNHDSKGGTNPSSIIISSNDKQACMLLDIQLTQHSFKPFSKKSYKLVSFDLNQKAAYCLSGSFLKSNEIGTQTQVLQKFNLNQLGLYVCVDHYSLSPHKGVSIVIAENELEARGLLIQELTSKIQKNYDYNALPFTFDDIYEIGSPMALIICSGEPGGSNIIF